MLWIKTLHVFFVVSWFAGLFYLPRLYVNLAQLGPDAPETPRLLTMSHKLYWFMHIISTGVFVFGFWLWLGYGIGSGQGWIHAKLALVAALVGYQIACGRLLRQFKAGTNRHSHTWYRWFNEIPTALLFLILALVIIKPF